MGPWTSCKKITDQPLSPQGPRCDITDRFLWGAIRWPYQKTTLPGIHLPRCPARRWGPLLCLIKLFMEAEHLQGKSSPIPTQAMAGLRRRLALVQCRRRVPRRPPLQAQKRPRLSFFFFLKKTFLLRLILLYKKSTPLFKKMELRNGLRSKPASPGSSMFPLSSP